MIGAAGGLTSEIADLLGRDIVGGRYAPGSTLPNETELSARFAAGRSAVREAVKILSAKGLVSSRPRRGTRVHPVREWHLLDADVLYWLRQSIPEHEVILELLEIRLGFECEAAALAAARGTDAELAAIRRGFEAMCAAAEGRTDPIEADCAFHEAIIAATGNRFYQPLAALIRTALTFSARTTNALFGHSVGDLPMHLEILEAIESRDPEAARAAMRSMIERVSAALRRARAG